jgi:hypothetical protein
MATLDPGEADEPALQTTSAAAGRAAVQAAVEAVENIRREFATS